MTEESSIIKKYFNIPAFIAGTLFFAVGAMMMKYSGSNNTLTRPYLVIPAIFALFGGIMFFCYGLFYTPIQWIRKVWSY